MQGVHKTSALKSILAVVAGYAVFVISSLLLFKISGRQPHDDAVTSFKILALIYGAVFSFLSGLVLALVAKPRTLKLHYILAVIIAGFALFSLLKAGGSHWTQLMAIFIFAPVSVTAGIFYKK